MHEQHLEVASPRDFPKVDYEAWRQRVLAELDGASLESLQRFDPTGLGRSVLCVDRPGGAPIGRRAGRGWLRVMAADADLDLEAARSGGAQAFEVEVGDLSAVPAAHDPDLLVEGHADLEALGERRPLVGGLDILGTLARDGSLACQAEEGLSTAVGLLGQAGGHRPIRVDLGPAHRAGGHAVQELAYMLGTLADHLRVGADPARLAAGTALAFDVGRDVIEGVAKLRAARVLWARLFGASGLDACSRPWIHVTTSSRTLEVAEPLTNVLRATTQVFAAAVGGADSVRVLAHDGAAGSRSALGDRLALNLQNILAEESHLDRTADAAGGSFLIEHRTDALSRAAWECFVELERSGGYLEALRRGRIQASLAESWEAWCSRVRAGEAHVLGVTLHPGDTVQSGGDVATSSERPHQVEPLPTRRDGQAAEGGEPR